MTEDPASAQMHRVSLPRTWQMPSVRLSPHSVPSDFAILRLIVWRDMLRLSSFTIRYRISAIEKKCWREPRGDFSGIERVSDCQPSGEVSFHGNLYWADLLDRLI
jgi:hypothetical protein